MSRKKLVRVRFNRAVTGGSNHETLVFAQGFVSDGPAGAIGRKTYMAFDGPALASLIGAVPAMEFTNNPEVLKALNVVRNFLNGDDL